MINKRNILFTAYTNLDKNIKGLLNNENVSKHFLRHFNFYNSFSCSTLSIVFKKKSN